MSPINIRLVIFLNLFVLIGLILSMWFGLGWLFVSIAFQRLIISIPITRNKIQQFFSIPVAIVDNKRLERTHKVLQTISIVGWFALALATFLKANVRLIDLLHTLF
jgi:uncharacterized membrane protein YccF (DUF307 family)